MEVSRLNVVLVSCLYYLVVWFSYAHVESVLYPEIRLVYADLQPTVQILIALYAVAPSLWLPRIIERPSQVALWALYLTVLVPSMMVPFHILDRPTAEIATYCTFMMASFAGLCAFGRLPLWKLRLPEVPQRPLVTALIVLGFGLIFLTAQTNGFHVDLSLANVYDRRADARISVPSGALTAYAVALLSHAVSPVLFGVGLVRRNFAAMATGCMGSLCIFALAGTKSELASLPLMAAVYWMLGKGRKSPATYLPLGMGALIAISALQFLILDRYELSVFFVRRIVFVPAVMSSVYWDFFSQNPLVWYGDSAMRFLYSSPYDLQMPRLIGEAYFDSFENNANGNIWAAGFGHAGYLGILITTVALGLMLRAIDAVSERCGFRLTAMVTILFSISWANGAIETSVISYGVAPTLVFLCLLRVREGASLENVAHKPVPQALPSLPSPSRLSLAWKGSSR